MRDVPVVMSVWFVMHDVIRETVTAGSLGMLVVGKGGLPPLWPGVLTLETRSGGKPPFPTGDPSEAPC